MGVAGDLCTLADVKTFLGTDAGSNDDLLASLISQVSAWVQGYCERRFDGINAYTWLTDGLGGDTLPIPEGPVTHVDSVTIDGQTIQPSTGAPNRGYVADSRSVTFLGGRFSRGRKNVYIVYHAGYPYVFTPGNPDVITGLPGDLRFAVVETVALRFKQRSNFAFASKGLTGETISFDKSMAPKDAMSIFNKYKKNVPW